jgi:hypothetical protein
MGMETPALNPNNTAFLGLRTPSHAAGLAATNVPATMNEVAVFGDKARISAEGVVSTFDAGGLQMPGNPSFLAHNSGTDSNVTGNATVFKVEFNSEITDQGSDFDTTTGTFTAPVAGNYLLTTIVRMSGITAAADTIYLNLVTSNRNYWNYKANTNSLPSNQTVQLSIIADMDAGDTAYVNVRVTGEASDVVDVLGDSLPSTVFGGCLVN